MSKQQQIVKVKPAPRPAPAADAPTVNPQVAKKWFS